VTAYTAQTWADNDLRYSITAARMQNIESGIYDTQVKPAVRATGAGTASGSSVWTTIAYNGEAFDTDTMHDNVTNNSRLTVKTAGYYVFGAQVGITLAATTGLYLLLFKNGSTGQEIGMQFHHILGVAKFIYVTVESPPVLMGVNEWVEAAMWNTGATATSNTNDTLYGYLVSY
jgi:hypothetical protein